MADDTRGEMDPEAQAADAIVRALEPLPRDSIKRVVEWMRDRYSGINPLFDKLATGAMAEAKDFRHAAEHFVKHCPNCAGKGTLDPDANGFRPRCGACAPFRELLARPPLRMDENPQ